MTIRGGSDWKRRKARAAKDPYYKGLAMAFMKGESLQSLTVRGRGGDLSTACTYAGLTEGGTTEEKAKRLLKWYREQK